MPAPNANDWAEAALMDADIDFEALSAQLDTYILGRRTFDAAGILREETAERTPLMSNG
jgi:hypothetical protein